jgi:PHS family inorganic phosphate transporter-like MFS transporter
MSTDTENTDVDSIAVEAFEELDSTKFGWLHVKAILVAGIGFFCDAYDLFVINLVVPMISYAYFDGKIPKLDETMIKAAAVIGTLLGQIGFGILGDKFGRKSVYGISLALMLLGAILSAMSSSTVHGMNITVMLGIWRFILGIGIGGDYPLSAVITSEYATVNTRGKMIAAVFAMQGIGQLVAGVVCLTVIFAFRDMIREDPTNTDYVWRICLGLGCVPAVLGAYFRHKLPETPRFTAHVKGNYNQAVKDINTVMHNETTTQTTTTIATAATTTTEQPVTWESFKKHYSSWNNLKVLLGCASSWFMLDIAFYGLGLNTSVILTAIGYTAPKSETYNYLYTMAAGNCIINLAGSVPGYYVTVALIEKLGRVKIQLLGFGALTILFVVLSAAYLPLTTKALWLFIVLYSLAQFFFNFGPNATTFIIPGEVFPTRFRTTSHGICAASGKLGAIISSYGFTYLAPAWGVQGLLGFFSAVMFMGFLCSFMVPETAKISLESLSAGNYKTQFELKKKNKLSV